MTQFTTRLQKHRLEAAEERKVKELRKSSNLMSSQVNAAPQRGPQRPITKASPRVAANKKGHTDGLMTNHEEMLDKENAIPDIYVTPIGPTEPTGAKPLNDHYEKVTSSRSAAKKTKPVPPPGPLSALLPDPEDGSLLDQEAHHLRTTGGGSRSSEASTMHRYWKAAFQEHKEHQQQQGERFQQGCMRDDEDQQGPDDTNEEMRLLQLDFGPSLPDDDTKSTISETPARRENFLAPKASTRKVAPQKGGDLLQRSGSMMRKSGTSFRLQRPSFMDNDDGKSTVSFTESRVGAGGGGMPTVRTNRAAELLRQKKAREDEASKRDVVEDGLQYSKRSASFRGSVMGSQSSGLTAGAAAMLSSKALSTTAGAASAAVGGRSSGSPYSSSSPTHHHQPSLRPGFHAEILPDDVWLPYQVLLAMKNDRESQKLKNIQRSVTSESVASPFSRTLEKRIRQNAEREPTGTENLAWSAAAVWSW